MFAPLFCQSFATQSRIHPILQRPLTSAEDHIILRIVSVHVKQRQHVCVAELESRPGDVAGLLTARPVRAEPGHLLVGRRVTSGGREVRPEGRDPLDDGCVVGRQCEEGGKGKVLPVRKALSQ